MEEPHSDPTRKQSHVYDVQLTDRTQIGVNRFRKRRASRSFLSDFHLQRSGSCMAAWHHVGCLYHRSSWLCLWEQPSTPSSLCSFTGSLRGCRTPRHMNACVISADESQADELDLSAAGRCSCSQRGQRHLTIQPIAPSSLSNIQHQRRESPDRHAGRTAV